MNQTSTPIYNLRLSNVLMPEFYGDLASDDGGCMVVPVVDDLHQVPALFGGERRHGPVVQDQQLHPCQALQHAGIPPVAAGQAERLQQPRHALIQHGPVFTAGAVEALRLRLLQFLGPPGPARP